ncbi:hypothetical protein [Paracoccus sp. KR1-242]|uniref:hypothetical protein n=1 Tax=Paracoccus sp. KR1-242 TaxID=3410028 RepID=UPI003BFE455E
MNLHIVTPIFHDELHKMASEMLRQGRLWQDLAQGLHALENLTGQKIALVDAAQLRADATIVPPSVETITDVLDFDPPPPLTDADFPMVEPVSQEDEAPSAEELAALVEEPAPAPTEPEPQPEPQPDPNPAAVDAITPVPPPEPQRSGEEVQVQIREMLMMRYSVSHIAKTLGCTPDVVRATIAADKKAKNKTSARPWSDDDLTVLAHLRAQGKDNIAIGRAMNRTPGAIRDRIRRLEAQTQIDEPQTVQEDAPRPEAAPDPEPLAPPAPEAPPAPIDPPAPVDFGPTLTRRQNRLVDHLNRLPDDFEPSDDLYLVESLASRVPIDVMCDQLGCDQPTIKNRYRAMLIEEITTAKGIITIDGQADLLIALRYRVQ